MNMKRLANLLLGFGLLLIIVAVAWWAYFYQGLMREVNKPLSDALSCLYASDGACAWVNSAAHLLGKTAYEPGLLWIGVGIFVAGLLLRLSLK